MAKDIYSVENMEVTYANGDYITTLNPLLAKKQKLTANDIELLKMTHVMRAMIFATMRTTDDRRCLKRLASVFENLEYLQQEIWGFDKDKNFHRWFEVPKCTCPKMDNEELIGSHCNITTIDCPVHGNDDEKLH